MRGQVYTGNKRGAGTGVRPPGDPTADGYGAFLYDNEVKAKTPTVAITLAPSQSLSLSFA